MAEQERTSSKTNNAATYFYCTGFILNGDQNYSNSSLIACFPIGLSLERSGVWVECGLWQPQQMVLDQILEPGQRGRLAMRIRPCLGNKNPG